MKYKIFWIVGPILTEFWIDQMAFGQPEHTCLNMQKYPFCKTMRIWSILNLVNQVSTNWITYVINVQGYKEKDQPKWSAVVFLQLKL